MTSRPVWQTVLYICQFAMCGISRPNQWQAAQALYVLGSLGTWDAGPDYHHSADNMYSD